MDMKDTDYTAAEILKIYQESCKRHQIIELETIKSQILEVKNNRNNSAVLHLQSVHVTREVNETLEDILKVCNFRTIIINDIIVTPDVFTELFNMLEYYKPVREIELGQDIGETDTWRGVCNACTTMPDLQSLTFKSMSIPDNYVSILLFAMEINTNIFSLKFDGCHLTKLPAFSIMENLSIVNHSLRELYLTSIGLYTREADSIARFLKKNRELKVLDLSHNFLGDRGLEVVSKGLVTQNQPGEGLSVFVVSNNQLSEKSGPTISTIIRECKNLHTLNVALNPLTDQVITDIADSLVATTCLEALGLQHTLLSSKGIIALSAAIQQNTSLQKINLKSNRAIEAAALDILCNALTNSKINKVEIDEISRFSTDPEGYSQMVKKLQEICKVNKSFAETAADEQPNISQLMSRKISLSCEPKSLLPECPTSNFDAVVPKQMYCNPSPNKPHCTKKSRFQITKVKETEKRTRLVGSRFKVSTVSPPPMEADEGSPEPVSPNSKPFAYSKEDKLAKVVNKAAKVEDKSATVVDKHTTVEEESTIVEEESSIVEEESSIVEEESFNVENKPE